MNCRTCNYSLWNNSKGQCPECGTPFKPSDFEFIPGAVRFHCPHCAQQYFGTDSHGHLEPRAFACVNCQQPLEMDSMRLTPEHGVDEEATQAPDVPWASPNLGFFAKWWKTCQVAMIRPHILGAGIRPGVGTGAAWWFAIFTNLVITSISWGTMVVFMLAAIGIATMGAGGGGPPLWAMGTGFGLIALFMVVLLPLVILIWGALAHVIMSIGITKPAHSLRHTYATLCYTSGATFINILPCIGAYSFLGGIWWMVSAAIGLKFSQRVSTGKAVAAAVVPPLVFVCTCTAAYLVFAFSMLGVARTSMATAQARATAANTYVDQAYAAAITKALQTEIISQQPLPNHIAEMVLSNKLTTSSFTLSGSGTTPDRIPVLGTNLGQVIMLPTLEEKRAKARLAQLAMPPVYRFGDFIFTYQGVPPLTPASQETSPLLPGLWLVFSSLDPTSPPPVANFANPFGVPPPQVVPPAATTPPAATSVPPNPARNVYVGLVFGNVKTIAPEDFAAALVEQNALRATFGLPPIPAPETLKQWTEPVPGADPEPEAVPDAKPVDPAR